MLKTKACDSLFLQSGHSTVSVQSSKVFHASCVLFGESLLRLFCGGFWCRMSSNRASAQRSRQRKQDRLDELEILV